MDSMMIQLRYLLLFFIFTFSAVNADTFSLSDALAIAYNSDPDLQSSYAELEAARARVKQAFAQTLPQISATASANWYHRNYNTDGPFASDETSHYPGQSAQLNLSQPLWRRSYGLAISQAHATEDQYHHQVDIKKQELLVRLTQTWFDIMSAQDSITAGEAAVAATKSAVEQQEKAVELELAARPALEDARSKYKQATADLLLAKGDLEEKLATLEAIIGPANNFSIPALDANYSLPPLPETLLETWLADIESRSPEILAASAMYDAANTEIKKQRAGTEPTIDIVGNISRNRQGSGNFPGQSGYDIRQNYIGLQLNVPIYSGGMLSAKVAEATALRNKAKQDLVTATRTARSNGKIAWYRMKTLREKLAAAIQTVDSAQLNVQMVKNEEINGLKSETDALHEVQLYQEAWRELQKTKYDLVVTYFKLRAVVGALKEDDLVQLDRSMFLRQKMQTDAPLKQEHGHLAH